MKKIIGILGKKGAGKDTAYEALRPYGYERLAFADPLYEQVSVAFGVTVASLQERSTKEVPQARLALMKCSDTEFKDEMLSIGGAKDAKSKAKLLAQPRSPRWILQHWGTEYRRKEDADYWTNVVKKKIALERGSYVFTDVRFPEEASMIESLGGILVRVRRPSSDEVEAVHASERALDHLVVPEIWNNDNGDITGFHGIVLKALGVVSDAEET